MAQTHQNTIEIVLLVQYTVLKTISNVCPTLQYIASLLRNSAKTHISYWQSES